LDHLINNNKLLQKHFHFFLLVLFMSISFHSLAQSRYIVQQLNVGDVFNWPHKPNPYTDFDWKKRALELKIVFF